MSTNRVPQGVPTGGQFAASAKGEAMCTLGPGVADDGEAICWDDAVDALALDDMEPGERRLLDDVDAATLIRWGYSAEYDSGLIGLDHHLNGDRVDFYSEADAELAPVLVTLPPPGGDDGPTLIDGHHRTFAAYRTGRPLSVEFHAPVLDEDGDVDYPSLPARFGGLR